MINTQWVPQYVRSSCFPGDLNPDVSQEAVVSADKGEAGEGVVAAGAGAELRRPTHRAGNHLSGELWVNVLSVSWTSLKHEVIRS